MGRRVRPTPTHGLYLLDAQHGVPLVGTELHQDVLARYAPAAQKAPTQVVAELGCVPAPDGGRDVEARLHGERVGLLAESDAAWYGPLLERAEQQQVRPGCAGHVRVGDSGRLEVELFLPVGQDPELVGPFEFPAPADRPEPAWPRPATVEAGRPGRRRRSTRIGLVAAALVLVVLAVVGYGQRERLFEPSAAEAPPSDVTPSPPPVAPLPAAPAPSPAPSAQPLARTPVTTPPPISNGGCDPNYSGACVPIASQVQCAGPGRSGPLVVRGPFRVTGTDLYQLDPDHDGIACGPPRPAPTIPPPPRARSERLTSATPAEPTRSASEDDSSDN